MTSRERWLLLVAAASLLGIVPLAATYYSADTLEGLGHAFAVFPAFHRLVGALPALGLSLLQRFAFIAVGAAGVRLLGLHAERDSLAQSWLVGAILCGTFFYAAAALGFASTGLEVVFLGVGLVFALLLRTQLKSAARAAAQGSSRLWLLVATLVGLRTLFAAMAPPLSYDAGVYHLGLLQQAELWSSAPVTPHLYYSALPMLAEYALAGPLWLSGDELTFSFGHALLLLGTLHLVAHLAREMLDENSGNLVYALGLGMPVLLFLTQGGKSDLFTCTCTAGALLCLLRALKSPTGNGAATSVSADRRVVSRRLLLMALILGAGVATKLTFVATAAAVVVVALWSLRSRLSPRMLRGSVLLGLLIAAPPYLRNFLALGNPVYPFATSVFGLEEVGGQATRLLGQAAHKLDSSSSMLDVLRLPWDLTFVVRDGTNNNLPGAFWIVGALALWFARPKTSRLGPLLAVAVLVFLPWQLTYGLLRFSPAFIVLMLVVAAGGFAVLFRSTAPTRILAGCTMAALLVISLAWTAQAHEAVFKRPTAYLRGDLSAAQYMEEGLRPFDAYHWLNTDTPRDAVIYSMGDLRVAYAKRRLILNGLYTQPHWERLIRNRASPEDVLDGMRELGATHVLVDLQHLHRVREHGWANFDAGEAERYQQTMGLLGLALFEDWRTKVYLIPPRRDR